MDTLRYNSAAIIGIIQRKLLRKAPLYDEGIVQQATGGEIFSPQRRRNVALARETPSQAQDRCVDETAICGLLGVDSLKYVQV